MNKSAILAISLFSAIISFLILIAVSLGLFQHIEYFWGLELGNLYIYTSSIFALFGLGFSLAFKKQINTSLIFLNSTVLFSSIFTLLILVQLV